MDIAQITLYAFWIFFAALIIYLRGEDKREGYPMESDIGSPRSATEGFPGMPKPKTFLLPHGGVRVAPSPSFSNDEINATPAFRVSGSPLEPTGNPLLAGVGPGSYANRSDTPDLTLDGKPKIVPLRFDDSYSVNPRDPDPRGKRVLGADGLVGGVVGDIWVDRSERIFRYYELALPDGSRSVLVPVNFCLIGDHGTVSVNAILGKQFAGVPGLRNPDQVTLLEEEKIAAYYGAGTLYATPDRLGPFL